MVPWKKRILKALQAAQQKLSVYYTATDREEHGKIYAIATIFSPSKKLQYFANKDWKGETDYMKQYREVLEEKYTQYQQQQATDITEPALDEGGMITLSYLNGLDMISDSQIAQKRVVIQEDDEIVGTLYS